MVTVKSKLEIDGKLDGEQLHPGTTCTYTRTHRQTTRKHNACGSMVQFLTPV